MEIKVGKGKGGRKISGRTVSEYNDEIRDKRECVAILKDEYNKATTTTEKRVLGREINSINSEISSLREGVREIAFDSVEKAQLLDAEIHTLQGEIDKYRDIDEFKIEDVMEEFGDYYYKIPDILDDISRELKTATGEEKRLLQDRYDVLDAIVLRVGIGERKKMIKDMLPDVKGIESPDDVAEYVDVFTEGESKKWFKDGEIKDLMMRIIKYGKPAGVKYVIDDEGNYVEEKDIDGKRVVGVLEHNIEERAKAIDDVGGVWTDVGETGTHIGKNITFTDQELDKLAGIKTPDEMYNEINAMCTTKQNVAFAKALGNIDDDGSILGDAGVMCAVPDQEIYDAFNRMRELESGVDGSGYEYMRAFLRRMFKYGAFEDDIYNNMSNCDDIDDLLGMIGDEIKDCSCTIRDTHEREVRMAFADKEAIEREKRGKGTAYMNRKLRDIFTCDTFEDHVYREMSEYEDPRMLLDRINTELSNAGVYDKEVIDYAIDGIDRRSVLDKDVAGRQLDDVFGDHFTKMEYNEVAKNVMSEKNLVENNRSALISRFRATGKEGISRKGKILAGKNIEGITTSDYNERWDKERQKMIKRGETKNIDATILKRQVDDAQKLFAGLVSGIPDDSMSSRDEIQYVFETAGLQPYIISNLASSVTDLEYVVDDNIKKLTVGMNDLIKKHGMYEDDIFREGRIYDAIDKRKRMELGDSRSALDHMKNAIAEEVGKLNMTGYANSIKDAMSKKIDMDYGGMDERSVLDMPKDDITEQFNRRIKRYRAAAEESIRNADKRVIEDLYQGMSEEENVSIPYELSRNEKETEEEKEIEAAKPIIVAGIHEAIEPFISPSEIDDYTDAIPKKPKKSTTARGKAEMKWWNSYMAKIEPVIERTPEFNDAGLALVMRKGGGKKYVVYGEGGRNVGFKNLVELDNWYKAHYGKSTDD